MPLEGAPMRVWDSETWYLIGTSLIFYKQADFLFIHKYEGLLCLLVYRWKLVVKEQY